MRTVVVVVFVAACGRLAFDELPPAASGSRLKLTRYAFESTLYGAAFFDSVLDAHCYPRLMADGRLYCVPSPTPIQHAFLDASCTQPVWVKILTLGCAPSRYVAEVGGTCASPPTIAELGARLVATTAYRKDSMGICTSYDVTTYEVYEPGPQLVPARDMVELEEIRSPATARLQDVRYESADGFRAPAPYFDQLLGMRCFASYERLSGDATQCEPVGGALVAQHFSDAACTQPKLSVNASCPAPELMVPSEACRPSPYYRAIPTTEQPLFTGASACFGLSFPGPQFFDLGPPVDLAPMAVTLDTGARIASYQVDDVGIALRDQLLDADCFPSLTADGEVYCLPDMMFVQTLFRDSACTQPADFAARGVSPSCPSTAPVPKYARNSAACSMLEDVRTVGIEITAPLYEDLNGCMPYTGSAKSYELGTAVPRSEFAKGVIRLD